MSLPRLAHKYHFLLAVGWVTATLAEALCRDVANEEGRVVAEQVT